MGWTAPTASMCQSALTGAGISHEEATAYNEGVQRAGTLVTVRVKDADAGRAETIMQQRNPVD
jgi:hypothetical protein